MNRLLLPIFALAMLLMSCTAEEPLSLYDLRCEDLTNPTAIDSAALREYCLRNAIGLDEDGKEVAIRTWLDTEWKNMQAEANKKQ